MFLTPPACDDPSGGYCSPETQCFFYSEGIHDFGPHRPLLTHFMCAYDDIALLDMSNHSAFCSCLNDPSRGNPDACLCVEETGESWDVCMCMTNVSPEPTISWCQCEVQGFSYDYCDCVETGETPEWCSCMVVDEDTEHFCDNCANDPTTPICTDCYFDQGYNDSYGVDLPGVCECADNNTQSIEHCGCTIVDGKSMGYCNCVIDEQNPPSFCECVDMGGMIAVCWCREQHRDSICNCVVEENSLDYCLCMDDSNATDSYCRCFEGTLGSNLNDPESFCTCEVDTDSEFPGYCDCLDDGDSEEYCACLFINQLNDTYPGICECLDTGYSNDYCMCLSGGETADFCVCYENNTVREFVMEYCTCVVTDGNELDYCECMDTTGDNMANPERYCECLDDGFIEGFCSCLGNGNLRLEECDCFYNKGFGEAMCECMEQYRGWNNAFDVCECITNSSKSVEFCECMAHSPETTFRTGDLMCSCKHDVTSLSPHIQQSCEFCILEGGSHCECDTGYESPEFCQCLEDNYQDYKYCRCIDNGDSVGTCDCVDGDDSLEWCRCMDGGGSEGYCECVENGETDLYCGCRDAGNSVSHCECVCDEGTEEYCTCVVDDQNDPNFCLCVMYELFSDDVCACVLDESTSFDYCQCMYEEESVDYCSCVDSGEDSEEYCGCMYKDGMLEEECGCLYRNGIFGECTDHGVLCDCYNETSSILYCMVCGTAEENAFYEGYCECLKTGKTENTCVREFSECNVNDPGTCMCRYGLEMNEEYCEVCAQEEPSGGEACLCDEDNVETNIDYCACVGLDGELSLAHCKCLHVDGGSEDFCNCLHVDEESEKVCKCIDERSEYPEYTKKLQVCQCEDCGDEKDVCRCLVNDPTKTKKDCNEKYFASLTATTSSAAEPGMIVLIVIVVILAVVVIAVVILAIVLFVCCLKAGKASDEGEEKDVALKDMDKKDKKVPEGFSASLKVGKQSKIEYKSDSLMIDGSEELKLDSIQRVSEVETGNQMMSSLKIEIAGRKPVEIQYNRRNMEFKKQFIEKLNE